ncbi:hypothetical protein HPP92_020364 [Vanilla planifolia]|uniref:C2H2-type domain-containing protein n=1 Tax=Vanilla planifolia TaxID=51239 RepID=A0A835PZR8_VANPL|nr:hypothetical protein HPP92_020766 [Vanilla planifolia]KAG0461888.1 hypothetical protein HPP92_020364 [Vanilla planifolia]
MDDSFSSPAMAVNTAASSSSPTSSIDNVTQCHALLFDLSLLLDKVHHVQSLVSAVHSADKSGHLDPSDAAISSAGTVIHDMISIASTVLFNLQKLALCSSPAPAAPPVADARMLDEMPRTSSAPVSDVVELDAAVLLAKYTHHCRVCGKGFRRDANLRMHMRAHGDEYKTRAALASKVGEGAERIELGRKYSCPQEGCRWNWKHEKFQPLKSVVCAKNHYRRSHCPKLYVCSRCGHKEFSVLSDLRTHEKHCGIPRWRCSCGTTFSRKDKLMGHVALFAGHVPAVEGPTVFEVAKIR